MNQINAMRQALEALENHSGNYKLNDAECDKHSDAVDALRQAIEQAGKAEPVLVVARHDLEKLLKHPEGDKHIKAFIPPGMGDEVLLYTHPPTAPTAPAQRPKTDGIVGWRWVATCGSGTYQLSSDEPIRGYSYKAPVYELLPTAQQPLTDAAIQATWTRTATYDTHLIDVLNFARAIEASHGIKGASL